MRIAALICGLIAGLFALLAPTALGIDLMTPFLALWGATASQQLLGTVAWYAPAAAAVLGGLLAFVAPGPGSLLLLLAGLGWIGFGVVDPDLLRPELLGPGLVSVAGALLAFIAGEFELMRRRAARRLRRDGLRDADMTEERTDRRMEPTDRRESRMNQAARSREAAREREEAMAREAALNMDPLTVPRDEAPPRPTHEIPLTLEDVVPTEAADRQPGPNDRVWQTSAPPRRSVFDRPDELDLQPRKSLFERPAVRVERRDAPSPRKAERRPERERDVRQDDYYPAGEYRDYRDEPRRRRGGFVWIAVVNVLFLAAIAVGAGYYFLVDRAPPNTTTVADTPAAPVAADEPSVDVAAVEADRLEPNVLPALTQGESAPATLPTLPMPPKEDAPTPALDTASTDTAAAAAGQTYGSPFDYCRAVGTIDYVDNRYTGRRFTAEIADALRVPVESAPDRVSWRCVEGTIMACASFDWPVCAMTPTAQEMMDYCLRNPNAARLLAPNGTWSCEGNKPKLPNGASWPVDDRGFFPDAWIPVLPSQRPTG